MKYRVATLLLFLSASVSSFCQSTDPAKNKELVETRNIVFVAQQVLPLRGSSRILNSRYDLTIRPDSIISFLPYFGRAYAAPVNPAEGGIQFNSVKFGYSTKARKKNRYEIRITPQDAMGISAMQLTVFSNGRATLQVSQTQKDPISFNGYIEEGRPVARRAF